LSYTFNIPYRGNAKLKQVMEKVKEDKKLQTYWRCSNVMAIERMGYTDHGPTHVKIVSNLALKLLRILVEKELIKPSIVQNYGMENDDAEVVVVLGSILHDLGMTVQRREHEKYSAILAYDVMQNLLTPAYDEEKKAIITSEVLHAIISHRSGGKPFTVEAGIVRVADALDMSEGRSRIPYESGNVDIYSVSAAAVDHVKISEGTDRPVQITIQMNNSAGLFQVDELLKKKLIGSGIESYVKVRAVTKKGKEKRLVEEFEIH